MASGLEVFDALKAATHSLPRGSTFNISLFDSYDLCKLDAKKLKLRGFDEKTAREVSQDLCYNEFDSLRKAIGIQLQVDRSQSVRSLVPENRLRETAGALADEEQTIEETLDQLDRIRHPERYSA